jgi:hypothetical protein
MLIAATIRAITGATTGLCLRMGWSTEWKTRGHHVVSTVSAPRLLAHDPDVSGRPGPTRDGPSTVVDPADAIADEVAANDARLRFREQGIVPIAPDHRIGPLLGPGECVVAVRRGVVLERRVGSARAGDGLLGDLYVTSCRLLFLGHVLVQYPLAQINELDIVAGGVRFVVGPGRGADIQVRDPRLLRVEIAAVREASRLASGWSTAAGQISSR